MNKPTPWYLRAILFCALGASVSFGAGNTPEGVTLPAGPETVPIAAAGKAKAPITISPQASDAMKKTAAELGRYLKRITGADFAVETGTQPKGITVGTLEQFPDESLTQPLAVRGGYDGVEAFAIHTDKDGIRLLGNGDLGADHAAHRFLELLGCRWFFQGETWTVVPQKADLSFNLNETSRPDILSRDIWFGRTSQKWEPGDPDANAYFAEWARGNRMASSLKVAAYHKWHALPKEFKSDFDGHPEYLALVKGKRMEPGAATQLCVTNPGLQEIIKKYVNTYFEKNPTADMVSLDPADSGGWCTCPECSKIGVSDQAFYLANIAAKELQKTHPGKFVGLLAYSWHSDPPAFMLEPNVYVQLTAGMNASKYTFDELFDEWAKKCSHIGIYEYYSYWEMDHCMLPGTGICNNYELQGERMKRFVSHGVNSVSGQAASNWGLTGLANYLAVKLMWNSSADVQSLKKDFYQSAFGPAAAPMQRYYERSDLANKPFKGASLLRLCLDDVDEATKLAASRPDVLKRLDDLKAYLVYNHIGLKADAARDLQDEKAATLDWFTWSYRTRNNYMSDWITFRSAVGRPAAEKWGETTWFWRNTIKDPSQNPWRVDKPITAEELQSRLKQMRADLGDVPLVKESTYSDRFVLVKVGESSNQDRKQTFSGHATYLLASLKGEALKFTLTKRDTGPWIKPDAAYSVTSIDGKSVASGQVPTGEQEIEIKMPGPGIYRFTCNRGGPGWDVVFPAALPNALVFDRTECRPTFMAPAYFYVPKGTTQFVMYTAVDSSATVRSPANRVATQGVSDGRYITIAVEKGEDGKMWSIGGKFRNLWFFNLPTVLSATPTQAFVPEDLARQDRLTPVLR